MITDRRVRIVLGSICAALVVVLGCECFFPIADAEAPPLQLPLPVIDPAAPAKFQMPPQEHFASIDERPVFDPSRKPVAGPPDAPAANGSLSLPSVMLIGVIIDHETRLALVKLTETAPVASYSVGTWLGGWQIVQIEADKIILRANSFGSRELRMIARSHTALPPGAMAGDGL